ncbi:MAG: AAA family ATPase [Lachnospiraceae bacterium]|nr:AAA family ATPase [Lachnospiraceae bacterium]
MAIFYPDFDWIMQNQMEIPEEGEKKLLSILKENLDDTYKIYFQSHISFAHPDIIIVKEGGGVLIIEVKDWNLNSYIFEPASEKEKAEVEERKGIAFGTMSLVNNRLVEKMTPFEQVCKYKDELYNELFSELYLSNKEDKKVYGVVKTAVYFSTVSIESIEETFDDDYLDKKYKRFGYTYYWGQDSTQNKITNDIKYLLKVKETNTFSDAIYKDITDLLTPSLEYIEQATKFELSDKQKKYVKSEDGKRQKIRGVTGSGKTLILAQRAINCYERTRQKVLILTFNITLGNYIRDNIARNARHINKSEKEYAFEFVHFHEFIPQMLLKLGMKPPSYETEEEDGADKLLEDRIKCLKNAWNVLSQEEKETYMYRTILIDEVQDFQYEWLKLIEDLFLKPNGEFVIFGDENQNIYNRELDDIKLPKTTIRGNWTTLEECYRLTNVNIELAEKFRQTFFPEKYPKMNIKHQARQIGLFDNILGQSYYCNISNSTDKIEEIYSIIRSFQKSGKDRQAISPNDICVLASNCKLLRELEYTMRINYKIASECSCETQEQYKRLERAVTDIQKRKTDLRKLRKIKKRNFRMNPGVIKLCTIHSFKGWEINTIFLVLGQQEMTESEELIYTALTRAKNNLVVINDGNTKYDEFFKKNVRSLDDLLD